MLGTAIRGVSDDAVTSGLLGVPVQRHADHLRRRRRARRWCRALSGLSFHTVSPFDGFTMTLMSLMIIVIGGLGNVWGGVIAALLIGVVQTMSVVYLSATMRDLIVYILVGITVLARPNGLIARAGCAREGVMSLFHQAVVIQAGIAVLLASATGWRSPPGASPSDTPASWRSGRMPARSSRSSTRGTWCSP